MKTLKIIQSCVYNGDHCEAGAILNSVDTRTAAELVYAGKAQEISRAPKGEIETRDPIVEHRDPVVGKKSKAKTEVEPEPTPEQ